MSDSLSLDIKLIITVYLFSVGEVIDEADLNEVLDVLESLDDTMATEQQVEFVRCSEAKMLDRYGLSMLPSIVYFDSGVPVVYQSGDLKNKDAILGRSIIFFIFQVEVSSSILLNDAFLVGWITKELENSAIRDVKGNILESVTERLDYVAVIHYDESQSNAGEIIKSFDSVLGEESRQYDIR